MSKVMAVFFMLVATGAAAPAWAGFFSASCEGASNTPRPDWVSRPDYSLPAYYVGIGSADKNGKSVDEQRNASENDAKQHLVEQIEVTIRAENKQSKQVRNNKELQETSSSEVVVTAAEVLRDLKVRDRWVDKDSCVIYSLMVIGKDSVAQAKREKLMRPRLDKMKALLEAGTDRDKNRDAQIRRQALEDAKLVFDGIDFALISEDYGKAAYAKRIADALSAVGNEIAESRTRMAVFALNRDGRIPAEVLGRMLDQLREGNAKVDRLMVSCTSADECLDKAKERGFGLLALLKVDGKIETSEMGALKGTLSVSKTVYDVSAHKTLKGSSSASAQVIGWGDDELDWDAAADKVMQDLK